MEKPKWLKQQASHSSRSENPMYCDLTTSGIYKITCVASKLIYVGSAVNFRRRCESHKNKLNNNTHDNSYLQKDWNFYRIEKFVFEVIELCEKEKLIEREQWWLDATNCYDRLLGYNILKKAYSSIGYVHTDEFKKNRSELYTGRKQSPELIEKRIAPLRGKPKTEKAKANMRAAKQNVSQETRDKIGLKHKGKTLTDEHRKIVSEAQKGNKNCVGRKLSDATRQKMKESAIKRHAIKYGRLINLGED